jgi:hypothetical protein
MRYLISSFMYWNNPLIEAYWPGQKDPVQDSRHNGTHCLFWNPIARFDNISTNQRLGDLCRWATEWLTHDGIDGFVADPRNHYDIANLVKLNLWIHDIRAQGIVKPWLILDQGDGTFLAGNGDSRLRCLERIPEIKSVPAFVSTHISRVSQYQHLEPVITLDQFAKLCQAQSGQLFTFRLTDPTAPFGMYWYEYNSDQTRWVTPSESDCVQAFVAYTHAHPGINITPEWFDNLIDWNQYHSIVKK